MFIITNLITNIIFNLNSLKQTLFPDQNDNTPLHRAIKERHYKLASKLIDKDVNLINAQNKYGETPALNILQELYYKRNNEKFYNNYITYNDDITYNRGQLIKLVLKLKNKGADFNISNDNGVTGFHFVLLQDNVLLVSELLDSDIININAQDSTGQTLLHRAVNYQHNDTVLKLLVKGAKTNIKNQEGDTPVTLAIRSGDSELIKLITIFSKYDIPIAHSCSDHIQQMLIKAQIIKDIFISKFSPSSKIVSHQYLGELGYNIICASIAQLNITHNQNSQLADTSHDKLAIVIKELLALYSIQYPLKTIPMPETYQTSVGELIHQHHTQGDVRVADAFLKYPDILIKSYPCLEELMKGWTTEVFNETAKMWTHIVDLNDSLIFNHKVASLNAVSITNKLLSASSSANMYKDSKEEPREKLTDEDLEIEGKVEKYQQKPYLLLELILQAIGFLVDEAAKDLTRAYYIEDLQTVITYMNDPHYIQTSYQTQRFQELSAEITDITKKYQNYIENLRESQDYVAGLIREACQKYRDFLNSTIEPSSSEISGINFEDNFIDTDVNVNGAESLVYKMLYEVT